MSADLIAATPTMARILGVSVQHIGRLTKSGDLPEPLSRGRWDVVATVQAFLVYRERQNPSASDDEKSEELLLIAERRRLTKEQADKVAFANAQSAGELVLVSDVEGSITNAVIALRQALQQVGRSVRKRLKLTRDVERAVEEEIDGAVRRFVAGWSGKPKPDGAEGDESVP